MRRSLTLMTAALLLAACDRGSDSAGTATATADSAAGESPQARVPLPPAYRAQLDSGNAAFRIEEFTPALRHYERATQLESELPAAWFGVYMAQLALGDTAAADQAMRRARRAAPEASLLDTVLPEASPRRDRAATPAEP